MYVTRYRFISLLTITGTERQQHEAVRKQDKTGE